jgi:hypothetical protein
VLLWFYTTTTKPFSPKQVGVGRFDFIPSKIIKTLDGAKIITICFFDLISTHSSCFFAIQHTIPDEIIIIDKQSSEVRSLIMFTAVYAGIQ